MVSPVVRWSPIGCVSFQGLSTLPHPRLSFMVHALKNLMLCLALTALGFQQVWGVPGGYLCGCTGELSHASECSDAICHPTEAPHHCAAVRSEAPGESSHHRHLELRESLIMRNISSASSLPPVVWRAVPSPFPSSIKPLKHSPVRVSVPRDFQARGSPSTDIAVERSVVRLI